MRRDARRPDKNYKISAASKTGPGGMRACNEQGGEEEGGAGMECTCGCIFTRGLTAAGPGLEAASAAKVDAGLEAGDKVFVLVVEIGGHDKLALQRGC